MEGLLPPLRACAKERLIRNLRKCRDAKMRVRYLIIVNLMRDRSPGQTAAALQAHRSTVYRVAARFREWVEAGLVDRREENGSRKVDETYREMLHEVVAGTLFDYGEVRPTWALELLIRTPGQNQKRYLAGAEDVRTRRLVWTAGDRKNSLLFLWLLWELVQAYPQARLIHVILDNYSIHSTQQVQLALQTEVGQRLRLHFLPPYCPDDNCIERTWQDLHANVTRNHRCRRMSDLMHNVRRYLQRRNRNVNRTVA